jgi:hypothetical protein
MKKNYIDKCFKDNQANTVLGQKPNLPIIVGLSSSILSVFVEGKLLTLLEVVGFGALFTWAWLEIFSGVNYFRRFVGALVMAILIYSRLY